MEIPDELYRQVKAKSALEGRPVREVAVEMFRRYVGLEPAERGPGAGDLEEAAVVDGKPAPPWFGALRAQARRVGKHDLEAIRESVARGMARERNL